MTTRVLRASEYRRMRWKNGGGWTTELASGGSDAEGFDWRISIADVESDGPFSAFAGCDRYIALLDGPGMELSWPDAEPMRLDQRLRFHRFAGEARTHGRLLAGPVRDFNVMVRRQVFGAEVLHRPLVGPMVFLPDAATTWFVYVAAGHAVLKDGAELGGGDSLLIEPGEPRNRVLSGGGEVVIAKLVRVAGSRAGPRLGRQQW
jgi:environmental stress-induced protein Ves